MEDKVQTSKEKHKLSCETHRAEVHENCKIIVKNVLNEVGVTVDLNDISTELTKSKPLLQLEM